MNEGKRRGADILESKEHDRFSTKEIIELIERLPPFAPRPVCRLRINGKVLVGRVIGKEQSKLIIKHRFGKKAISYNIGNLEAIEIIQL